MQLRYSCFPQVLNDPGERRTDRRRGAADNHQRLPATSGLRKSKQHLIELRGQLLVTLLETCHALSEMPDLHFETGDVDTRRRQRLCLGLIAHGFPIKKPASGAG